MTVIHRTTATVLAALASFGALLIAASTAGAKLAPPDYPPNPSSPGITVVQSGSPWWTFVLVAAAAIAATLLVIGLVSRLRRHRTAAVQVAH